MKPDLFKYESAHATVAALANEWKAEIDETEKRRKVRYHEVDLAKMKAEKRLMPHETYIPVRIIDTNIRREQAVWIAYITQSPRAGVFKCLSKSSKDTQKIEAEFTKFVRYDDWEKPFFQTVDGCQTHGTDFVETVFDEDMPGHFRFIHLGHDGLWYPKGTEDLQLAPYLVTSCCYSKDEFKSFRTLKDGWNPEAIDAVLKSLEAENSDQSFVKLDKVYFKDGGVVYVEFLHDKAEAFVKAPEPLFMGVRREDGTEVEESEYPIDCLQYCISENGRLMDVRGRVFLDFFAQEAATNALSAFVNGLTLSSRIQVAPKQDNLGAQKLEQVENMIIRNGGIWNSPVEFFHIPPPPSEILQGLQVITTQNATETSQVDFAVNNRKDSRKTATEVSAATQQSSMLSSVQVTLLSRFMRNVFRRAFRITRSQVQRGIINSECAADYGEEYIIQPAGDVDVVRRQERLVRMRQDWPVIQNTPMAQVFLEDIIRESYPENGDKYVAALRQGNVKDQLLAAVPQMMRGMMADPNVSAAMQPYAPQMMQMEQQIQAALNPEQEQQAQAA